MEQLFNPTGHSKPVSAGGPLSPWRGAQVSPTRRRRPAAAAVRATVIGYGTGALPVRYGPHPVESGSQHRRLHRHRRPQILRLGRRHFIPSALRFYPRLILQ